MSSRRTIAALSAVDVRSFVRPNGRLCARLMGSGYSSQTIAKPEQGLVRPD